MLKKLESLIEDIENNGLSDTAVDFVYVSGLKGGIFSGDNAGSDDRRNSVYCLLETLKILNSSVA